MARLMNYGYVFVRSGQSATALAAWTALKTTINPIAEAWIGMSPQGWTHDPVLHDNRDRVSKSARSSSTRWIYDGLVLACQPEPSERRWSNTILFLNGCQAGYDGAGPRATTQILREAGFSDHQISLIPSYNVLHLVRGENRARVATVAEPDPSQFHH